jgi:hypothetical protein
MFYLGAKNIFQTLKKTVAELAADGFSQDCRNYRSRELKIDKEYCVSRSIS